MILIAVMIAPPTARTLQPNELLGESIMQIGMHDN